MQENILEKNPDPELRVYAVWYNMIFTDAIRRWPEKLMTDPRVIHFWDDQKILGRWFGRHPEYLKHEGQAPISDRVYWDAYLLYAGDSRWIDKPDHLVSWGGTIVSRRDQIKPDVDRLSSRKPRD